MITKLIASGLRRLNRQALCARVSQPRLRALFSNDLALKPTSTGKIRVERMSQHESAMRQFTTFKENIERIQSDDAITFHITRLYILCENLDNKTAEQLQLYSKLAPFKEFQMKVNEKLTQFNERGKFN